jgi:hypothetical protein
VFVVIGLVRPRVVAQVDGLGADQPEGPPDFGFEVAEEDFVMQRLEQLETPQFGPAL